MQRNTIISGDCLEVLGSLEKGSADLIFADPPFNIGYDYDKYHDKLECKNYIAWTRDWMSGCYDFLKPNGSFYIAIGDEYAANVKVIADELGLTMRNWIIWHYTFGQQTKIKFARSHVHIFYFIKDENDFVFNDLMVRVPSARQLVYNDKRSNSTGKLPDDVWNTFSRVCGTFKERELWHPCQMPEVLLARIIRASSNSGDLVFDPFNGSGTTAAAAIRCGRDYLATDISQEYCDKTEGRLEELRKQIDSDPDSELKFEMQRLCVEMDCQAREVAEDKKILYFYTKQINLRVANEDVTGDRVIAVLKSFDSYSHNNRKVKKPGMLFD